MKSLREIVFADPRANNPPDDIIDLVAGVDRLADGRVFPEDDPLDLYHFPERGLLVLTDWSPHLPFVANRPG